MPVYGMGWRKVLGPGPQPGAVLLVPTAPSVLSSQHLIFSPPPVLRHLLRPGLGTTFKTLNHGPSSSKAGQGVSHLDITI